MCEKCGASCPYCGHSPGERVELPPPPQEPDPVGPDRSYVCRYCNLTLDSAQAVSEHQKRHPGVGVQLVTDVVELHRVE